MVPPATGVKMWSSGQATFSSLVKWSRQKISSLVKSQNSFLRPVIEAPSKSSPLVKRSRAFFGGGQAVKVIFGRSRILTAVAGGTAESIVVTTPCRLYNYICIIIASS